MSDILFPPLPQMEAHNQMQAYGLLLAILDMGWYVDIQVRLGFGSNEPEVTVRAEHRHTQKRIGASSKGVTLGHALYGALSNLYRLAQKEQPKSDYSVHSVINWPGTED
jgi:hypothetical protein